MEQISYFGNLLNKNIQRGSKYWTFSIPESYYYRTFTSPVLRWSGFQGPSTVVLDIYIPAKIVHNSVLNVSGFKRLVLWIPNFSKVFRSWTEYPTSLVFTDPLCTLASTSLWKYNLRCSIFATLTKKVMIQKRTGWQKPGNIWKLDFIVFGVQKITSINLMKIWSCDLFIWILGLFFGQYGCQFSYEFKGHLVRNSNYNWIQWGSENWTCPGFWMVFTNLVRFKYIWACLI